MSKQGDSHKLEVGCWYATKPLQHVGWTVGDGSGNEGYNWQDYFDPIGRYRGPDQHGIEPMFLKIADEASP